MSPKFERAADAPPAAISRSPSTSFTEFYRVFLCFFFYPGGLSAWGRSLATKKQRKNKRVKRNGDGTKVATGVLSAVKSPNDDKKKERRRRRQQQQQQKESHDDILAPPVTPSMAGRVPSICKWGRRRSRPPLRLLHRGQWLKEKVPEWQRKRSHAIGRFQPPPFPTRFQPVSDRLQLWISTNGNTVVRWFQVARYPVIQSFTGFSLVLPGFTGFYEVLLGFTGFYLVLPCFTGFLPGFT